LCNAAYDLAPCVVYVGHNPVNMVTLQSFTPHRINFAARSRGCYTCTHFHGIFYAEHLLCERNSGRQVIGTPSAGCAFSMRATGADDT